MKDLLKQYFNIQDQIYAVFGYVENWIPYTMEWMEDYYWKIGVSSIWGKIECVRYSSLPLSEATDADSYEDEIRHDRFLKSSIWKTADYTLILCDTHTDGVKLLRIFDNALEER